MKLLDKLKDALFEEEYEEVEDIEVIEKPKKEKKKQKKAKNVEEIKEEKRFSNVKVSTFETDEDEEDEPVAKKIAVEKEDTKEIKYEEKSKPFNFPIEDDDFASGEIGIRVTEIDDIKPEKSRERGVIEPKVERKPEVYKPKEEALLYQTSKEEAYVKNHTKGEYGGIRNKDKKSFKPSPNISPVYGIIGDDDANIREVPEREVRLTSALRSEDINLDDVRRKAYGTPKPVIEENIEDASIADDIAIDLTEEKDAPKVKKVTMGDAEEYFQDLGLEYNNDYIDEKKEKASGRRVTKSSKNKESNELPSFLQEKSENKVAHASGVEEADDDNLFDLIDSMYDK